MYAVHTHNGSSSSRSVRSCDAQHTKRLCPPLSACPPSQRLSDLLPATATAFALCTTLCCVQLYQLLSDRFPFWDVDLYQIDSLGGAAIREGIMHGPVLFPLKPWFTSVHSSAQDLIVRMLERDVSKRITAAEALAHPWFEEVLGAAAAAGEVQRQTA